MNFLQVQKFVGYLIFSRGYFYFFEKRFGVNGAAYVIKSPAAVVWSKCR
jgi:hypothetical protein